MVDFFAKFKDKIIAFFIKDSKKSSEKRLKEINGSKNLIIFIAGSLGIATFLVVVSLVLYAADGTIQLDLSRPVLQEAREAQKKAKEEDEKQKKNEKNEDFSPQGGLSSKDMSDFERFYSNADRKIHSDEFSENVLSDESLKITDQ